MKTEVIKNRVISKSTVILNKGDFVRLQFFAKLKRVLARLKNKVTERQFALLVLSNPAITLDKSKTEWKIIYGANLEPAEYVYGEQLVATVIECDNPPMVNLAKLALEYPEAYTACVWKNGSHLRFNLKK